MHTVQWTCLDKNGQDACRIAKISDGWTLDGTAVFSHQSQISSLSYRLVCNDNWCSIMANVNGWIGAENLMLSIIQESGSRWLINGRHDESLDGLLDIDLGFTPASNTNALRRLNLKESEAATSVAIWLDTEDWTVKKLHQEYTRIGPHTYDYASPHHDYRASLKTTAFGIVAEYPGVWRMINHVADGLD